MLYIALLLVQIVCLFLLSKILTGELSLFFHRLTKSKRLTVYLLAFLFLPGTIIHELSHYLMAKLLFVYAGSIHLLPKIDGNNVTLGTVAIGKTDPFRRFLIGAAPFFFGTTIILLTLFCSLQADVLTNNLLLFVTTYIVFEVGNTMFSSKKDMEGALELFVALIILVSILFVTGVRIPNIPFLLEREQNMMLLQQANIFLAIPLVLDCLFIILLKSIRELFR